MRHDGAHQDGQVLLTLPLQLCPHREIPQALNAAIQLRHQSCRDGEFRVRHHAWPVKRLVMAYSMA